MKTNEFGARIAKLGKVFLLLCFLAANASPVSGAEAYQGQVGSIGGPAGWDGSPGTEGSWSRSPLLTGLALPWNTFEGGLGAEEGTDLVVGQDGSIYVTGYGNTTWADPIRPYTGDWDAFVAKFDRSGALLWNTFLGGTGSDYSQGIVLDVEGNIYITGDSGASWGEPRLPYTAGSQDAFVARLNGDGSLQWNTFLGGADYDICMNIVADDWQNVYVIGTSDSPWGTPLHGFPMYSARDFFVAKLNSNGLLHWHTFWGGLGYEHGSSLQLDESGNIYTTGWSDDSWGAPLHSFTGSDDIFVAKFDGAGSLEWNTFLGGSGTDWARTLALAGGNIYLTGWSAGWEAPLNPPSGNVDILVAKLDQSGTYSWHTFLGGAADDMGNSLVVDSDENIYITGEAGGTWGAPLQPFAGYSDIVIARLDKNGSMQWHTFLGGTGMDWGRGIALNVKQEIHVVGLSDSTWGTPLHTYADQIDVALVKVIEYPSILSVRRASPDPTTASTVDFTVTFSKTVTGINTAPPFNDFVLSAMGNITGASIMQVNGSGTTYTVTVNTGSGAGTIRLDIVDNNTILDMAGNPLGGVSVGDGNFDLGETYKIVKTTTFADVPLDHMFWKYIEAFYNAGLTTGCSQSPKMFCPNANVTRAEMAVFLERAMGNFAPTPSSTGMFSDVPGNFWAAKFIEEFHNDGITTGCMANPLKYCPNNNVTRQEMAVFIERALGNFNPDPTPSGIFSDVPAPGAPAVFTSFIDQFYNDGITTGCSQNPLRYCPLNKVTRQEMAVFIVRAFHIPMP